MEHFVAYHSAQRMRYELKPSDELRFLSRKLGLLKKAVGNTVWVVQGTPEGKTTAYSLCGAYVADRVDIEDSTSDLYVISGHRVKEFSPPLQLNSLSWFPALLKSQSNFSLGFNRLNDGAVVHALAALQAESNSSPIAVLPDVDPVMELDALEQIDALVPADYIGALKRLRPTEQQLELLRVHMAAPDQKVTAPHLARALGFPNWRAAIAFYGKFAGKLCAELNVAPATKLAVLARPYKSSGLEYGLHLRPSVIEALKELGVDGRDSWSFPEELAVERPLVARQAEGNSSTVPVLPDVDLPPAGTEGAARLVSHLRRERNRAIVEAKKAATLNATGRLCCEVCGFDFSATYGAFGEGFCEVHHLVPLSAATESVTTTLEALAILCSNCHRIIHRSIPMLSVAELSKVVSRGHP